MGRNNKDFNYETDPSRKERESQIENDPYSVFRRDLTADHVNTQAADAEMGDY
jgi:hypothetical protein